MGRQMFPTSSMGKNNGDNINGSVNNVSINIYLFLVTHHTISINHCTFSFSIFIPFIESCQILMLHSLRDSVLFFVLGPYIQRFPQMMMCPLFVLV